MTASVVGGQQYSRPGHSDPYIMAELNREGVFRGSCLNNHLSSRVNVFIPTVGTTALVQRLTNVKKNIIPEG